MHRTTLLLLALLGLVFLTGCQSLQQPAPTLRGTGDLGLIIERATGSVLIVDNTEHRILQRVEGLGDLSHASVVFSRDERYGYVFGRDGGLTKIDLLTGTIAERIIQSGNSIGGAISQDGRYVAVSNYEPGGVKVFDSRDLTLVADIPATYTDADGQTARSKTVGLVDAPGNRFIYSLFDAGEIRMLDMSGQKPEETRYTDIGRKPYDALMSPDGREYIAGLFGEDGMARLDLWHPEKGVHRILPDYGRGEKRLPVYKMPHLEGWAMAGDRAFVPAVGHHQVLVIDTESWSLNDRIPVQGQPVFVMASPANRQVWVNFAHPRNNVIQVIDMETHEVLRTLEPGDTVLHMEFTARGHEVWVSCRDSDQVVVYNTRTLEPVAKLPAKSPSGIFFTHRAHNLGL
ncbi:cytochrome D1 domain-containing protein [Marinobacteraceae bacterium S3BR75-40.1]